MRVSTRATHLLHEAKDAVQQLRDEGLHSVYVLLIKCVDEVAQRHHSIHTDQQPGKTDIKLQTASCPDQPLKDTWCSAAG